jgi:hypothetical protein
MKREDSGNVKRVTQETPPPEPLRETLERLADRAGGTAGGDGVPVAPLAIAKYVRESEE